jgi:hypothetical protein
VYKQKNHRIGFNILVTGQHTGAYIVQHSPTTEQHLSSDEFCLLNFNQNHGLSQEVASLFITGITFQRAENRIKKLW